jgi:hypothetical protein
MTAGGSYLLLRRGGLVWGVPGAVVEGRSADGYRIRAGEATLAADEILDVVDRLRVWPVGPETVAGLAVHGTRPVLVVDPSRPPRALRPEAGELVAGKSVAEKLESGKKKRTQGRAQA